MKSSKTGANVTRSATSGRFTTKTKSAAAAAAAVVVLRDGRAARVASALSQANTATGLLTAKRLTSPPKK